jgi:putative flavoprotein involved in K+ transport
MIVSSLPGSVDTLVVGAGHAGLVMSKLLADAGREHLLVDRRDRLGGGWLDRWDDFVLVTPNWISAFPGWPYDGPEPNGFMGRDAIASRVARYAEVIDAPVALSASVDRLTPLADGGFRALTSRGELSAERVVVATGSYHRTRIPAMAANISPRVTQLHSHDYRNPGGLPEGGVLIIGSGQTGLQLAEELFGDGRPVFIAVGSAGRAPRRYRGRDLFEWLVECIREGPKYGVQVPTAETLPDPRARFNAMPAVSGHGGGHDTNLRQFAADGMTLAGRLIGADGERLTFAEDLAINLARADAFFDERMRGFVDAYIERAGFGAPPDDRVLVDHQPPELTSLDLRDAGISTVIWATGWGLDYSWIDAPITDEMGYPKQVRGVAELPSLYFVGLLWQHSQASASLGGPELDGPHLVEAMAREGR